MPKMDAAERQRFYYKALHEQRHLLRTAINGMTEGDLTQALHVATSIRVLVHETGSSVPLLKHVRRNYLDLPILDRKPPEPPNAPPGQKATVFFFCPISAQIKAPEGTVSLLTELLPEAYAPSILGNWWVNACMILPGIGPVSRRELILGLANKEGGAHVDADITAKYKTLLESQFLRAKIGDKDLGALNSSRLVAGKAGVELLECLDKNFPK